MERIQALARLLAAAAALGCCVQAAHATPFFTQDPRTLTQGLWRIESHFLHTDSAESLVDGNEVPLLGGRESSSLTVNTRVRYGVRDDLTVFLDIPYVRKHLEARDGASRTTAGLGDLVLLAKYKVRDDRQAKTRAAVAVATKLRTGEYRGLPPELGLGSGQVSWQVVGLAEKQSGRTTWYGSAHHVWTGTRGDIGVDPGEIFFANLAAEHPLHPGRLALVAEVNHWHQGRFHAAGLPVSASGATLTSLAAGLQYRPMPGRRLPLVVEAEVQVPVRKDGYVRALADALLYVGAYAVF